MYTQIKNYIENEYEANKIKLATFNEEDKAYYFLKGKQESLNQLSRFIHFLETGSV